MDSSIPKWWRDEPGSICLTESRGAIQTVEFPNSHPVEVRGIRPDPGWDPRSLDGGRQIHNPHLSVGGDQYIRLVQVAMGNPKPVHLRHALVELLADEREIPVASGAPNARTFHPLHREGRGRHPATNRRYGREVGECFERPVFPPQLSDPKEVAVPGWHHRTVFDHHLLASPHLNAIVRLPTVPARKLSHSRQFSVTCACCVVDVLHFQRYLAPPEGSLPSLECFSKVTTHHGILATEKLAGSMQK